MNSLLTLAMQAILDEALRLYPPVPVDYKVVCINIYIYYYYYITTYYY